MPTVRYRVPEMNVQNGVLKALSFLFEYIGEMGKDYIYAVTPLLEDALMDRDLVHRQTACTTVKRKKYRLTKFKTFNNFFYLFYLFINFYNRYVAWSFWIRMRRCSS